MSVRTRKKTAEMTPSITKDMRVSDVLALLPTAEPLLARYGLSCFHCSANTLENLEDGCRSHGFTDEDVGDLLTDLNELLRTAPKRPQTLTLMLEAAKNLRAIAEQEGKLGHVLEVGVDEGGGFCMEFREKPATEDQIFFHPDLPDMRLSASALTLSRIGGSTIDFRDGRFKLDLPQDMQHTGCACGKGECGCQSKHASA